MKKILLIVVLLFAGIFVGVNVFGAVILSNVLENAIGAPVSVGRVNVGILSSNLGVHGVKIFSPKGLGFEEKILAEIHELSMQYVPSDFFKGKIHLKTVRLDFGDVTIEKNGGKINLLELGAVKGIAQGMGAPKKEEPKPGPAEPAKPEAEAPKPAAVKKPGPQLQIDEVFVNIGKTRYVDSGAEPPLVKEYDLGIHDERFKDVTNAPSLVKGISFLILRKVGLSSLTANFDILMKGVGGEIQTTFEKLLAPKN